MRRRRQHTLTIHRYPDRPCEMPHRKWSEDYAMVREFSEREVVVFINSHTNDYLKGFCEHTPTLETYVQTPETIRGVAWRMYEAIRHHFARTLKEGGEP